MIYVREHQRKEPSKAPDPFSPLIEARRRAYAKRWGVELPEDSVKPWKRLEMLVEIGKQGEEAARNALNYKPPRSSLASIIGDIRNLVKVWKRIGE